MLFAVPLFIRIDWESLTVSKRLFSCFLIGVVGAAGLTVLSEIDCMWKAFDKGMNTYAWSLGIAQEIDELLAGKNHSSPRKHIYNTGYDGGRRQDSRMEPTDGKVSKKLPFRDIKSCDF
jgi:hypothetical protein